MSDHSTHNCTLTDGSNEMCPQTSHAHLEGYGRVQKCLEKKNKKKPTDVERVTLLCTDSDLFQELRLFPININSQIRLNKVTH